MKTNIDNLITLCLIKILKKQNIKHINIENILTFSQNSFILPPLDFIYNDTYSCMENKEINKNNIKINISGFVYNFLFI